MKNALTYVLLAFIVLPQFSAAQNAFARKGLLDLRQWNFEEGAVNLTGDWEFYMSELVTPEQLTQGKNSRPEYIDFPATWNELSQSLNPGEGFATYRLKVLLKTSEKKLAFELPHFYSSYILWVNARKIASNGAVGTSAKTSEPQWLPQTVNFVSDNDTLDIVIQVSNFHHAKGGVREHILLGTQGSLTLKRQVAVASNLTLFFVLVLVSVFFAGLYFLSKKEPVTIWFAALCFTWGVRALFTNLYPAIAFFPALPWELCVKVEYISLYLSMICAIFFLGGLFKGDVNETFKYFMCICNSAFIFITIFFDANVYTQFLPVYLSFVTLLLLYVVYVLVRAVINERQGVWLLITSLFLGVILFSYDLISYQGFATFHPVILNIGYISMFVLMTITLLQQTGYLKRTSKHGSMLTYDEFFGKTKTEKTDVT